MLNDPALILAISLLLGVAAQILARVLGVPGIVLLLLIGAVVGPDVLGIIDPKVLAPILPSLVGAAVAVILFEGGLQLRFTALRREGVVIRRLITTGALLTAIFSAVAVHLIMEWSWALSALFGTLVIVTGPTVVTPLLNRIGVRKNLQTILQAEGVLIDPIGAMIAVITLDVLASGTLSNAAFGVADLATRLGFGAIVGFSGGVLLSWLLKRQRFVPDDFANILSLAWALALFHGSNAVFHESGIMTVTVAGVVVGNSRVPMRRTMIEFKEQLTYLLIGLLFIVLTASIRLADVLALGWRGLATVLAVMLIVRPLVVIWSTRGSGLKRREKMFMSWLAPRGIVAAAVASLFAVRLAEVDLPGSEQLQPLVFLVIAVTVFVQGLTAGPLAGLLKVRRPRDNGYAMIGANDFARAIAKKLMENGEEVVLVDKSDAELRDAEAEGFRVIYGNALETSTLRRAQVGSRIAVVALTNNEGVNLEALRKVSHVSRNPRLMLVQKATDVTERSLREINAKQALASPTDVAYWSRLIKRDLTTSVTVKKRDIGSIAESQKTEVTTQPVWRRRPFDVTPLVVTRSGFVTIYEDDEAWPPETEVTLLVHKPLEAEVIAELSREGWSV